MAVALGYLHWRLGERFLLFWAGAALLWVLRYALGIMAGSGGLVFWPWVLPLLAVARGAAMFAGARLLLGRGIPWWGWGLLAAELGWLVWFRGRLAEPLLLLAPYGAVAFGFTYAGWALIRSGRFQEVESWSAALALAAFGLLQLAYPFSLEIPWIPGAGFALSTALQALIAVTVLLAFLRSSVEEVERVARREELALTRALGGFVTICAHCKRVRDEAGDHVPIQEYVEARTHASVRPVICPRCANG